MVNLRQYIEGARFPASKQDLLKYAQEHKAPADVIDAIQKLGDKRYNSVTDVTRESGL